MLKVDFKAVGLKSYSQSQLLDLDGGHWDLEIPSSSKESVTFRFDNLPKDSNGKEENFYARSSLKDLEKTGIVAIDFGTKSTIAIYMNKNVSFKCSLSFKLKIVWKYNTNFLNKSLKNNFIPLALATSSYEMSWKFFDSSCKLSCEFLVSSKGVLF